MGTLFYTGHLDSKYTYRNTPIRHYLESVLKRSINYMSERLDERSHLQKIPKKSLREDKKMEISGSTPEEVLISFFKKSSAIIKEAREETHRKYPHLFNT